MLEQVFQARAVAALRSVLDGAIHTVGATLSPHAARSTRRKVWQSAPAGSASELSEHEVLRPTCPFDLTVSQARTRRNESAALARPKSNAQSQNFRWGSREVLHVVRELLLLAKHARQRRSKPTTRTV
jgi:hypothetical protein